MVRLVKGGLPEDEAATLLDASGDDEQVLDEMLSLRRSGVPLAYVTGRTSFLGLELFSEPGVVVPRADTEPLARHAIARLRADEADGRTTHRVADVCTGSGNVACALAASVAGASVWALDLMGQCVRLAYRNVRRLGLADRVQVAEGDLFAPVAHLAGTLDMVVSAPPFISTTRLGRDRAHLLEHEPKEAFDGGPYGLTIHQRLVVEGLSYLRSGGWLLIEFGEGQAPLLERIVGRSDGYDHHELFADGAGVLRGIAARKRSA